MMEVLNSPFPFAVLIIVWLAVLITAVIIAWAGLYWLLSSEKSRSELGESVRREMKLKYRLRFKQVVSEPSYVEDDEYDESDSGLHAPESLGTVSMMNSRDRDN